MYSHLVTGALAFDYFVYTGKALVVSGLTLNEGQQFGLCESGSQIKLNLDNRIVNITMATMRKIAKNQGAIT